MRVTADAHLAQRLEAGLPGREVKLLSDLAAELQVRGWQVSTLSNTLCLARSRRDGPTGQLVNMASAFGVLASGENVCAKVSVQENRNSTGDLVASSITLIGNDDAGMHSWDFSLTRGHHQHDYVDGRRCTAHRAHSGSLRDIAQDIESLLGGGDTEASS